MQNRDILFPGRRPHEQREEKVVRAKFIFSTCYGRRNQASLDPGRLTEDELVQITLDYAENRREYRQMVRKALEEEYYGSSRALGAAVTDVLRVFERTFFWYVVRRLPAEYLAKWEAIKSSNDRSLQGFCKYVVPDASERAGLFAGLRACLRGAGSVGDVRSASCVDNEAGTSVFIYEGAGNVADAGICADDQSQYEDESDFALFSYAQGDFSDPSRCGRFGGD